LTLEDGTESFLETAVNNYQSIHNIPEEGKSQLQGSGSLQSTFNIYTNADLEETINATSHYYLQVDVVSSEIQRFAHKHEGRLHHHDNAEAIQLLDNTCIVRKLQRKKNF
jgi:hypothetical protein